MRWWWWVRHLSFVCAPAPAPTVVATMLFLSLLLPLLLLPPPSFLLPLPLLVIMLPLPFLLLPLLPLLCSHSHSQSCSAPAIVAAAIVSAAAAAPTPVFMLIHVFLCADPHYPVTLVGPSFGLHSCSIALSLCPLVCLAFVWVCSCSSILFGALVGLTACSLASFYVYIKLYKVSKYMIVKKLTFIA